MVQFGVMGHLGNGKSGLSLEVTWDFDFDFSQ